MAKPDPLPEYIYKIIPTNPQPIPKALPLSDLDKQDGYIHLSTAAQASKTADRFFTQSQELWLLKIPLSWVEDRVKWEENSHGVFPHLHDVDLPNALGSKEVGEVLKFEKSVIDSWSDVLEKALK